MGTGLRGARFIDADVSGIVMRGVEVQRADIDSPWLFDGDNFLRVNGVDVVPFVDAELTAAPDAPTAARRPRRSREAGLARPRGHPRGPSRTTPT